MASLSAREKSLGLVVLITLVATTLYLRKERMVQSFCAPVRNPPQGNISILSSELQSPDHCIRSAAALDLQKVGVAGEPALSRLMELTNDAEVAVRWRSQAAIGHIIGYDSKLPKEQLDAIEAVAVGGVKDSNSTVRRNALFTLRRVNSERAFSTMIDALDDPNAMIRSFAAAKISEMLTYTRDKDKLDGLTANLQSRMKQDNDAAWKSYLNLYRTIWLAKELESSEGSIIELYSRAPFGVKPTQVSNIKQSFVEVDFNWLFGSSVSE